MSMDWFSDSMAFSTGMTCMPMPAPPGGTIGVTFSSGSLDIRSKKRPSSGCSSNCFLFMLVNSALPGTNIGSTYCLTCSGFSQLYSNNPTMHISFTMGSSSSLLFPVAFISCSNVSGFRTFIFSATSAISSVTTQARPQYSGSSTVTLWPMRSVIIWPSFKMHSLGASFVLVPLISLTPFSSWLYQTPPPRIMAPI